MLVAKIDAAEAFAPIDTLRRNLTVVGAVALLVVVVTSAWLSGALLGPLRELTRRRDALSRGAPRRRTVPAATRSAAWSRAFNGMVDELREKNTLVESKNRENEELLLNVLPAPIANRLRGGEKGIADGFAEVTVAFADLVGFTAVSSQMPPADVVDLASTAALSSPA